LRPRLLIKNDNRRSITTRVRQKCKGANGVIATPTPGAEERDLGCASFKRGEQSKLRIGRIFVGWKARDGHTGRLEFVSIAGAQRVEVTNDLMEWQAERSRVPGAAISGDYQRNVTPSGPARIE
jgi:hypothetical protein